MSRNFVVSHTFQTSVLEASSGETVHVVILKKQNLISYWMTCGPERTLYNYLSKIFNFGLNYLKTYLKHVLKCSLLK